ncbi:MAG TPA: hypothetical protein VEC12_06510 [Bacteroidia bacterium]|nr:hypothetical protein [Bacteroidia bacterium]
MEKKIDLHKARDFSITFSDTFAFIKQNFKSIGKSLVMIVAPVYLIASLAFSFFSVKLIQAFTGTMKIPNPERAAQNMLSVYTDFRLWITILLFFIAVMLAVGVIFSYINLYRKKGETGSEITPSEVWSELWRRLPKFIGYSIGYGFFFIIGYLLLVLFIGLLMTASPLVGGVILFFGILALMIYLVTFISVLVPVIFYEDCGFFESLGRTSSLIKGNFWVTFGINFVAYIIVSMSAYIVSLIIYVPIILTQVGSTTFDTSTIQILVVVYLVVLPVILFFGYIFQYTIGSLNYFSLLEKHDHVGLRMKVDAIGDADAQKTEEQY